MSKSKSKSKSTSLTFPENYWSGEFDNYQYYDGFNKYYRDIVGLPLCPPTLEGDQLRAEIEELLKKQENRKERKRRKEAILREIDDFNSEYAKALLIGPDSHPHVFQLMNAMSDFALIPIMHFKRKFMRPRPIQVEPRIDPMIPVPGHPSYPSGHSTQNFLIAHTLSEVIGDNAQTIARVFEIARNIAQNRGIALGDFGGTPSAMLHLGTEYYAFRLTIDAQKTTGAGACGGCGVPATIVLNEIMLDAFTVDRLTTPLANTCLRWQAAGVTPCSATPVRNTTWGAIKSFYR